MSIFEEVKLTWNDKDYIVKPDRVMGLISVVEDFVTIEDLMSDGLKRARISQAYAAALNYAGAFVTSEQIYNALFSSDQLATTTQAVYALLTLMIPPEHLRKSTSKPDKTEKKSPTD